MRTFIPRVGDLVPLNVPVLPGGFLVLREEPLGDEVVHARGYEKLFQGFKDEPVDVKEVLMKPVSPNSLLTVTKRILQDK